MTETEEDREFYAAAEAAFIRRRGTPFLLSSRDFSLLRDWRALQVPIEAIEQGIDDAFSKREARGAAGRINSLSYCRDAVLAAWERRAETAVGRGAAQAGEAADEASLEPVLAALAQRLAAIGEKRPQLLAPIETARLSVERLASSGRSAGDVEASLARLDKKLAGALLEALPDQERRAIADQAEARLSAVHGKMDDASAARTLHALERRMLREILGLPRLTLLP